MCRGRPPRSSLPNGRWAESFADDLNTRRGIVSGRVALLPRSTEIQPHVARIRPSPQLFYRTGRFELTLCRACYASKMPKCFRKAPSCGETNMNPLGNMAMNFRFIYTTCILEQLDKPPSPVELQKEVNVVGLSPEKTLNNMDSRHLCHLISLDVIRLKSKFQSLASCTCGCN